MRKFLYGCLVLMNSFIAGIPMASAQAPVAPAQKPVVLAQDRTQSPIERHVRAFDNTVSEWTISVDSKEANETFDFLTSGKKPRSLLVTNSVLIGTDRSSLLEQIPYKKRFAKTDLGILKQVFVQEEFERKSAQLNINSKIDHESYSRIIDHLTSLVTLEENNVDLEVFASGNNSTGSTVYLWFAFFSTDVSKVDAEIDKILAKKDPDPQNKLGGGELANQRSAGETIAIVDGILDSDVRLKKMRENVDRNRE